MYVSIMHERMGFGCDRDRNNADKATEIIRFATARSSLVHQFFRFINLWIHEI